MVLILPRRYNYDDAFEICEKLLFMCDHCASKYLSTAVKKINIYQFIRRGFERLTTKEIYFELGVFTSTEDEIIERLSLD